MNRCVPCPTRRCAAGPGQRAALLCTVCVGLAVRLCQLQLLSGDFYTARAQNQQLRHTVVPADRGRIFSADGALLAANSSCWTLPGCPPGNAGRKTGAGRQRSCPDPGSRPRQPAQKFQDRKSNDCLLRYRVDRKTADAVRDFCEQNQITGVRINQDSKRWYPQGEFLASVLGFTNVDNDGVAGLELAYNDTLSGSNGVVLTAVNAWGYTLEQSYETELRPIEGSGRG